MKGFETACYYTKSEFNNYFDISKYNNLREKYKAGKKFPTVYDKISCTIKDEEFVNNKENLKKQIINTKGIISINRNKSCCFRQKRIGKKIDISNFNNILNMDEEEKFINVEPMVTMEQLAKYCIDFNLMPPIITEFKHMTIGGAISGLAGESNSINYGLMHQNVIDYDVILADGKELFVSKEINQDLFYAIPGSCGTISLSPV